MTAARVFVSCGATTAPLIPLLARCFGLVVPDGDTAERLRREGVDAIGWEALADRAALAGVPARAGRLAEEWRAALAREARLFAFGGHSRADVVLPALEELLRARLAGQLVAIELGRALVRHAGLAAVVLHEDVTGPVRALLAATGPLGVPSLHVPHGLYAEERVVGADVHGAVHTDLVAVGGIVQRDWFARRGVPPGDLVVTGNPAWDHLCRQPRASAAALGLPPGRVVTLATTWLGADSAHHGGARAVHGRQLAASLRAVAALQRSLPPLHLVLKLHPSAAASEEGSLRALAAQAGARVAVLVRDRLPLVLAASDVLVTLPSTVAVEAVIAGTPVIATEFFYEGDAVLTVAADAEAIEHALRRVLGGWGASAEFAVRRREFIARYNGPSDGRAAERVAALVAALVTHARAAVGPPAGRSPAEGVAAARALIEAGDHAGALRLLEDAAGGGGASGLEPERLALRARALVGLGLVLLERGAHDHAERHLREAAALDAGSDWAWCGLGVLAALHGEDADATRLLERALALNPSNPDAQNALAIVRGRGETRGGRHGTQSV